MPECLRRGFEAGGGLEDGGEGIASVGATRSELTCATHSFAGWGGNSP
jgi:hypothetical protein